MTRDTHKERAERREFPFALFLSLSIILSRFSCLCTESLKQAKTLEKACLILVADYNCFYPRKEKPGEKKLVKEKPNFFAGFLFNLA